jgi:hypothetical protein
MKTVMKTDNRNSEKDLNANPDSRLNTNKPVTKPDKNRFPESLQAREEMEKRENQEKDDNIELLADDVSGTVGDRVTGSNPNDIAGVSDLDRGMLRAKRR